MTIASNGSMIVVSLCSYECINVLKTGDHYDAVLPQILQRSIHGESFPASSDDDVDNYKELTEFRSMYPSSFIMAHNNINSFRHKFNSVSDMLMFFIM